jgi:hypothetical protein
MQTRCKELAAHKVGEINLYKYDEQPEELLKMNHSHELTTYLCEAHFNTLMKREEVYYKEDERFKL